MKGGDIMSDTEYKQGTEFGSKGKDKGKGEKSGSEYKQETKFGGSKK